MTQPLDRFVPLLAATLTLTSTTVAGPQEALLEQVRDAITGSQRSVVKSLILSGVARVGFNGVTARPNDETWPFEIRLVLPDKFILVDEIRGTRTKLGCIGNTLIFGGELVQTGSKIDLAEPKDARTPQEQFARLSLALLAETGTPIPLRPVPNRSSALTLHFRGDRGFGVDLDVDALTKLPLRLRYHGRVGLPQRALTKEEIRAGTRLSPRFVDGELVLSLTDRRIVDGINIPHRLTLRLDGTRLHEMIVRSVAINPALGPEAFR